MVASANRPVVDLRSDTVTVPTAAMRRAMAAADVGDDVYGEDPTVARLEAQLAEQAGFEAGLFVPSGTMGNQIALAVHCERGTEIIVPEGAHVYEFEPGAMAVVAGVLPRVVSAPDGVPDLSEARALLARSPHQARVSLLVLENTHNSAGGTVVGLDAQREYVALAGSNGLPAHLDGARAFNAAAFLRVALNELLAGFSSASVCLSKGLGAPVGSVLLGSAAFVAEAHRYRKLLGGGMRQAGVLAAAALVALEEGPALLTLDHERAGRLAERLAASTPLTVDLRSVQTNMVFAAVARADTLASARAADELVAACAARRVLFNHLGGGRVRLVTHHQVSDDDLTYAASVIEEEADRLSGQTPAQA